MDLASALGSIVLVRGGAGVGKTRLAAEAASRASRSGAAVLWGTCYRPVAYAPFVEALEHYVTGLRKGERARHAADYPELARVLPSLEPSELAPAADSGGDQLRVFAAVARFLSEIAADCPVLLVLDDLHLADDGSLQLLVYLSRLASRHPWLILGTYREEEIGSGSELARTAAELRRSGHSRQLELLPLGRGECDRLVDLLLTGPTTEGLRAHLFDTTLGNPLFIVELVGTLQAEGRFTRREGAAWTLAPADRDEPAIPGRVVDLIAGRVGSLDESTRDLLALAAAAGMEVDRTVLERAATLSGNDERTTLRGLERAVEARVLAEREEVYAFSHPLFRETVYRQLGAARREYLHRIVARTIEELQPADVEALAYHFSRGRDREKSVIYLERAGDRASAAFAHRIAERHYREVLTLLAAQDRPADLARAQEKLGAILPEMSRYDEAFALLAAAMASYREQGDADGLARAAAIAARAQLNGGSVDKGIVLAESTLREVSAQAGPLEMSRLHLSAALLHQAARNYEASLQRSGLAESFARASGDAGAPALVARAETIRGTTLLWSGQLAAAREALRLSVADADAAGALDVLGTALPNLAGAAVVLGDFEECRVAMERAVAVTERLGDEAWAAFCTVGMGAAHFFLGDWKAAGRHIAAAMARLRTIGEPTYATAWGLIWQGALAIGQGRLEEARAAETEAATIAERSNVLYHARVARRLLAAVDLFEGRNREALAGVAPLLPDGWEHGEAVRQAGFLDVESDLLLANAGWAYQELGDAERAERASSLAVHRMRACEASAYLLEALCARSVVQIEQGRFDAASISLAEALDLARQIGYPWGEARVLELEARLQAAMGNSAGSRELLDQSAAILTRLRGEPSEAMVYPSIKIPRGVRS
jgi:tetratricopeptide (TPR) repeat protein